MRRSFLPGIVMIIRKRGGADQCGELMEDNEE